jgi:unsaturated chondroitin disaccharide hydrolase
MILEPTGAAQTPRGTAVEPGLALPTAIRLCIYKTRANIQRLADEPKACGWAVDGNYFENPEGFYEISNWTSSFFTGMALLAWRLTGDVYYLKQVNRLAPHYRLKVFEHGADTMHDLGFLYSLYSVALYKLTGEASHREVGLRAAEVLASRFEPKGKYIRAWGRMDERDTTYAGLAIIDSMMNLPLLFWAAAELNNQDYFNIALQHAETTLRHFVRPDGSVFHAYRFDLESGRPVEPDNYCGFRVESHWARGAAWGIYGFALTYGYTRQQHYLETAIKLARNFVENLDEQSIPVWDFNLHEGEERLRDSSAAAIAVCGLKELLRHAPEQCELKGAAARMVARLCSAEYLNSDSACPALLRNAQVGDGQGRAQNVYASWGDYFFMEALSRELGQGKMFW